LLGLISVGGVVVLGMIAERYDRMFRSRSERETVSPSTGGSLADAESERYVRSLVEIRRRLHETLADRQGTTSDPGVVAALDRSFVEALAATGLERVEYQEIDSVYRAWLDGHPDVPEAYRRELERHRDTLSRLDLAGYDPIRR
jgi:hypothetical protein